MGKDNCWPAPLFYSKTEIPHSGHIAYLYFVNKNEIVTKKTYQRNFSEFINCNFAPEIPIFQYLNKNKIKN